LFFLNACHTASSIIRTVFVLIESGRGTKILLWRFGLVALGVVYAFTPAWAQTTQEIQQRTVAAPTTNPYATANSWTVGVVTGDLNGASLQMTNDLARTLNKFPELRIVPMVGTNSIQNINDLLYLKGVDVAIVQQDVLSHLRRTKRIPGIENRIQYIAKLHSEEFHVLARMKYLCLSQLSGRKVNFGPEGSGAAMMAQTVFEAHQVKVQPQYFDHETAIEKLRAGELDATVFVSGKPSTAFRNIRYLDNVHFLDVEFLENLQRQRDYLPVIMTHDDYPDLIAPNETVATIAVSTVMAVPASKPRSEEYVKTSRFVTNFFSKFERLKEKPQHAKWQEVNLNATVSGWTRFQPAQQWLDDHKKKDAQNISLISSLETRIKAASPHGLPSPSTDEIRVMFLKFLQSRKPGEIEDREELFNQFMQWRQNQN
jgi:uncharacterized protein